MCDLAIEQARRGHAVGVVCEAGGGDRLTGARLAALGPHLALGLFRTPMSRHLGFSDVSAYVAIRAYAAGLDVDVMHGHGAKGGAHARLAAQALKRAGRTVVACYTPHGGSLHYHPASLLGRIYMRLEQHLARFTDALIFESAYAQGRYETQIGRPTCPARVIANGLGAEDFAAATPDAEAADILFVGELRMLKGVDVLLRALARVRQTRPVRAVIVGDGPDAASFKAQSTALGLDDAVAFREPMQAREAFRLGRALVVPSRAESLPYIVLEAAGAGLPILASNVGGIPEIVAGSDTALLPAGNDAALAHAMLALLDDPAAAADRAARLRQAVGARFTVAAMTEAVLDVYQSVAPARPPG